MPLSHLPHCPCGMHTCALNRSPYHFPTADCTTKVSCGRHPWPHPRFVLSIHKHSLCCIILAQESFPYSCCVAAPIWYVLHSKYYVLDMADHSHTCSASYKKVGRDIWPYSCVRYHCYMRAGPTWADACWSSFWRQNKHVPLPGSCSGGPP